MTVSVKEIFFFQIDLAESFNLVDLPFGSAAVFAPPSPLCYDAGFDSALDRLNSCVNLCRRVKIWVVALKICALLARFLLNVLGQDMATIDDEVGGVRLHLLSVRVRVHRESNSVMIGTHDVLSNRPLAYIVDGAKAASIWRREGRGSSGPVYYC